jgi:hypothetical protein
MNHIPPRCGGLARGLPCHARRRPGPLVMAIAYGTGPGGQQMLELCRAALAR